MIALLPLDDRPCNRLFPPQIGAIGATRVLTPPRELLGRFNDPGQPELLADWLLEAPPQTEAFIVSIDALCYGGLVASRRPDTALETAHQRLETLQKLKATRPSTPILAFNVLMRLAITMDGDDAVPHYYNVMRWARLRDEAHRFDSPDLRAELAAVEAALPPALLRDYQAARARNHAINLAAIEALARGTLDFLLVTQEDCTPYGLHRAEQDALREHVAEHGLENRFALHPGADEAALTLLARWWNEPLHFRTRWLDPDRRRHIALFEDIPYEDALHAHVRAIGAHIQGQNAPLEENSRSEGEAASIELWIAPPLDCSQRAENRAARMKRRAPLEAWLDELEAALDAGDCCALIDVTFPNGADRLLLRALHRRRLWPRLIAYGAWNTAGNTTGTVLAQCAAWKRARDHETRTGSAGQGELNRAFLCERVLDDGFYQGAIRERVEARARREGTSPLNMTAHPDQAARIEARVDRHVRAVAALVTAMPNGESMPAGAHLPWSRTFEAEIRVEPPNHSK